VNAESHEEAWRAWSAGERARLLSLPRAELLLAVQTGALDNLVEEDAKTVLAALAGFKSVLPSVRVENHMIRTIRPTGRRPALFTGNGLAIGPRITVLMVLRRHAGVNALTTAGLMWAMIFALGNHWLFQHSAIG